MSENMIKQSIINIAGMMEVSARTAPKSRGEDFVKIMTILGDDIERLADAMLKYGIEREKKDFDRDSKNVRECHAVVLLGLKDSTPLKLNCGACGYPDCKSFKAAEIIDGDFKGPICSYRLIDLGIALGSAAKTAQIHNADNRIMYRAGVVARSMGLVDWDYVLAIPLSATGKNLFFDRKT
jgi:uncharacterized ferredoxin-like protein